MPGLAVASLKETIMLRPLSLLVATAVLGSLAASAPASAGNKLDNRDGCGMYSPEVSGGRRGPKVWRYDPRSWCYKPRGYYGYYGSGYWVPRAEMRYRNRYEYRGPTYTYYPAWGY
jgi:hypothetical protein